jgi:hypothetical protein
MVPSGVVSQGTNFSGFRKLLTVYRTKVEKSCTRRPIMEMKVTHFSGELQERFGFKLEEDDV